MVLGSLVSFVVGWLAVTNFPLAGFNMLPAFPMDGGCDDATRRTVRSALALPVPVHSAGDHPDDSE